MNRRTNAAGNLLYDHIHHYTYDAENSITTMHPAPVYIYDAKGSIPQTWNLRPCDCLHNARPTTMTPSTFCATKARFLRSSSTGKERDTESGNDYFEARYYSSSMGRFMSPDWSAKIEPVPYSKLDDPQTLNLYAYVGNNPMTRFDADGHFGCQTDECAAIQKARNNGASDEDALLGAKARRQAQQQKPTAAPAPTTQYKSVKAAGIGAEQTYNPASKSINKEFNGNIYENGQGKCCFIQTPNIGTESTSAPPDVSTLPSGATRVATFHTHGADSHGVYDDEHFSPADIRNTGTRGVPFFLGTPQGVIRMYDPATQKITTFKETAP